jgi:hypothetical protein
MLGNRIFWSPASFGWLLLAFLAQGGLAFQLHQASRLPRVWSGFPLCMTTKDRTSESRSEEIDTTEEQSNSELKFIGEIGTVSSALPYKSKDDVVSFFKCPENRNLFITAGGKRECKMLPMTPELLEEWTTICEQEGKTLPDEMDEIFTVKTGGVHFPGLTLETSATMGIKLTEKEFGPLYEVAMIGEERKVKGLPPVVYLFNKLTGGGSGNGTSNSISTTDIVCDFGQEDSKVVFKTDTSLVFTVRFPSVLMKILPTNKEKAEEQGSVAITKAVAKDIEASMVAYEEAYRSLFN